MIRFIGFITLLLFNFQTIFSTPNYSMQVKNSQILNDSTISFEVYINSNDSSFELTSYQCALCIDNILPVDGFTYVKGSSNFIGIVPSVGLGYNITERNIVFTFASLPGSVIILKSKLRIGKFLIKTKPVQNTQIPLIK